MKKKSLDTELQLSRSALIFTKSINCPLKGWRLIRMFYVLELSCNDLTFLFQCPKCLLISLNPTDQNLTTPAINLISISTSYIFSIGFPQPCSFSFCHFAFENCFSIFHYLSAFRFLYMSASIFCTMTETFRKIFFACRPGIHALLCLFPIPFSLPSFSFFIKTFFLRQFKVHSKIDEKAQTFPICLLPHTCAASRIISLPHYSGAFVTMMNLQ